ncbi:MAG: SPOR domain-containing protein [Gammaproteobacteria bacterium]
MTQDYAKKTRSSREKHSLPGWAWMLGGLTVGLFVALLVFIKEHRPETANTPPLNTVVKNFANDVVDANIKHNNKNNIKTENKTDKPIIGFDFYKILPEIEVPIPDLEQLKKQEAQKKANPKYKYVLQAGSFRQLSEADKLKANLALLGVNAEIQTVTINKTDTWHRVRIGPFTSARKMDKIRHRLQKKHIRTMVLKLKT